MKRIAYSLSLVLLTCSGSASLWAGDLTGNLYFTTFGGGNNVHSVSFTYTASRFNLGAVVL